MNHLSFYWLPDNRDLLIKGIESEFAHFLETSVSSGKISLPPLPEIVIKIQRLCSSQDTSVHDVADCLLEDPGLTAIVVRVANSVIFNRRNIICTDLITAVSRLGINRVRDIVTAQAIEQLKNSVDLSKQCNLILSDSAVNSRKLAATMVMVVEEFRQTKDPQYNHLEVDKALLAGLLADIGLFCIVNEYHLYLSKGNYLAPEIALQIFNTQCAQASLLVLNSWGFDTDFLEVSSNEFKQEKIAEVTYLDVARIANHILMFRRQDEDLYEHAVEFDLTGAEILYKLTNMRDIEFNSKVNKLINTCGL
ncbi:HDOD domain-containing protein [Vibrio sinensis]|uniref:HDOD domain-containing protein n=1 Tax=Vibrio sinensis TaxID=2302434 RepID=A0A3A6QFY0_9VIBR|nr:HDOD domain-containing protein [Vibrio sinensis]RJX64835.1 HDOD domain-containing protein [Vibrio sinensis]